MDHVLYGERFSRGDLVTDSWVNGKFVFRENDRKFRIFHLHGDIRYKPHKVSRKSPAKRLWPVLVVGDLSVKRSLIAGSEALVRYFNFYKNELERKSESGVLLVAGFGFRDEDFHISSKVKSAIESDNFSEVYVYDAVDRLAGDARYEGKYVFVD